MNSIEREWRKFLKQILTEGQAHEKDDKDILIEHLGNHCFIENITDMLFCHGENINLELFLSMIGGGVFNINGYPIRDEALQSYVQQLDDHEQIYLDMDEGFIYTYPERLMHICQADRSGEVVYVNQVETIVNRLREHSGSNRAVANLYMCAYDRDEQHIPCLNFVQATIRDNELVLHVMFRSNDCYSAFPSNMLFLNYLGLKIVDMLKDVYPLLKFKGINYNSTSLHIYAGDLEQAKKVIKED